MATSQASGVKPGLPCQSQAAATTGSEIAALRLTARVARPSGCSDAFSSAFQAACRTAATRTSVMTARGTGRVYRGGDHGDGGHVDTSIDSDTLDIRYGHTKVQTWRKPARHLERHHLVWHGQHPGAALHRHPVARRPLPPVAQGMRRSTQECPLVSSPRKSHPVG